MAHLPDDIGERPVVREARARSIGLCSMSRYRIVATGPARLMLGFGDRTERAIHYGIAGLLRSGRGG